MDIECATCGEPWDMHHLKFDEPGEWGLSDADLKAFMAVGRFNGPADPVRQAAEAAGWEFAGDSLVAVLRCPCCRKQTPLRDALARKGTVKEAVAALGDDEDAIASHLGR